jgi:hypothetical protein
MDHDDENAHDHSDQNIVISLVFVRHPFRFIRPRSFGRIMFFIRRRVLEEVPVPAAPFWAELLFRSLRTAPTGGRLRRRSAFLSRAMESWSGTALRSLTVRAGTDTMCWSAGRKGMVRKPSSESVSMKTFQT